MIKHSKKKASGDLTEASPAKKVKFATETEPKLQKTTKVKKAKTQKPRKESSKSNADTKIKKTKTHKPGKESSKPNSETKIKKKTNFKPGQNKFKSFSKNNKDKITEKPADWNEFKKKKKELQIKRKQSKSLYEVSIEAKKIGEKLKRKNLKEGPEGRLKLTEELHTLLGGKQNYPKLVLTHDMARIVQLLLKYGSEKIRREVAEELIPTTVQMLESKYAKFCVKHMLKYGDSKTRSEIMRACYGNAVKLASHAVSAAIFDYGYTTWASQQEKHHLVQEFYGDMYKQSKDNSLKHVRDIYKESSEMKIAVLGAMKANLGRILNKSLLDSHLVQTVLMQYLEECSTEDRSEMITQIASHIVILSNSKEGAIAVMHCYWYATNKDRKVMMKSLKEHVLNMCKHEHSHTVIIAILDSADDTVLLNKILLGEILSHATDLLHDEWGRKVLLWLVAPGEKTYFHPNFIKELDNGRENCNSKKDVQIRRKEILDYCLKILLGQIASSTDIWLQNGVVAVVTFAVLKAAKSANETEEVFKNISNKITDPEWVIKEEDKEVAGIEHAAFHMLLKKLLQHDKTTTNSFASVLANNLTSKTVKKWIKSVTGCNRACFFLVNMIENSSEETQAVIKEKIDSKSKALLEDKQNESKGAEILLKKLS